MLLLDATNLSGGGGGTLLKYLIEKLEGRRFHAVVSHRTGIKETDYVSVCSPMNPFGMKRQRLLEEFVSNFAPDRVLFFGNLPSRKPLAVDRSYTYFHNAHLVASLDQSCRYSMRDRLRYFLLRRAVRKYMMNTTEWIFQTHYVKNAFEAEYGTDQPLKVFPFFDEAALIATCESLRPCDSREGYIFVSDDRPHKNHVRLFDAWEILLDLHKVNPLLRLTVPRNNVALAKRIEELNKKGCRIENHGIVPRDEALRLTAKSRFVVFPSLLETLGLGLIEGILLGASVISTDNEGLAEVIGPSATFNPLEPKDIAEVIARSIQESLPKSEVVLRDEIGALLNFIAPIDAT